MADGLLERHDALPSTMERAHRLAEDGAPAGTGVVARRQTAGRGRQGRSWHAPEGGLWLSVVARPTESQLDPLAIRAGLALAELLESSVAGLPAVQLKWPNDLLLDGRKVGGILVESRWQGEQCLWVVIGVGINLSNAIPESLAVRAVAVSELVPAPAPAELAEPARQAVHRASRGGLLDAGELARWQARDALFGRHVEAPVAGVACGITPQGALRVRRPDGEVVAVLSGAVTVVS